MPESILAVQSCVKIVTKEQEIPVKANEQLCVEAECCKSLVETVDLFSTVAETFPEAKQQYHFWTWFLNDFNLWADKESETRFFKTG